MFYQAGLVLEGGGMKGLYTAGVLDFFLEKKIQFSHCYGVSAGACALCNFISKQKGRTRHVILDYLDNKRYCSLYSLFTTGDLFSVDTCYNLIPNYLQPYDYEAAKQYPGKAYAVATNIETGKAEYFRMKNMKEGTRAVRASSSLPLVSRNVHMNGKQYLDGGISDPIPIEKAISDGNTKNIVVLTKEIGYKRKAAEHLELLKLRYLRYPKVYELMKQRHISYNAVLEFLEKEEMAGRLMVIRPQKDSNISRIEKDYNKLQTLYQEGYADAEKCHTKIRDFLKKE